MKVFGHAPGTKPSSFILVGAASGRRSPPVVADHLEREEHVFHLRAAADVVDGVVAGRGRGRGGGDGGGGGEGAGGGPGRRGGRGARGPGLPSPRGGER